MSEQRTSLPANASNNLIDSFLASLVSIISISHDYNLGIKSVGILFTYLKNGTHSPFMINDDWYIDPKVFRRFRPNKLIIKNM